MDWRICEKKQMENFINNMNNNSEMKDTFILEYDKIKIELFPIMKEIHKLGM